MSDSKEKSILQQYIKFNELQEKKVQEEKIKAKELYTQIITHPLIRQASESHFKHEKYRSAVLDAMVQLEQMIKTKAKFPKNNRGKELSGSKLMHRVFDSNDPILNWCSNDTQIGKDELEGYKLIMAGAMIGIRNPKAHAIFTINPIRAVKLLTLATLLAELVDASKYVTKDK